MLHLPYTRTILRLTGHDVRSFLQGITTQDVNALDHTPIIFTAFLSPQGKLLFDAFLITDGDSLLLDLSTDHEALATDYIKRYKLRADVTLAPSGLTLHLGTGHPDPRHPQMPRRNYLPLTLERQEGQGPDHEQSEVRGDELPQARRGGETPPLSASADQNNYHQQRFTLSIPESAYDTRGDDVAMDLGYDLLHAISFTKGCYVGQEVTARMHYKSIARRGIFHVAGDTLAAPYTPILAGDLKLGEMRSSQGTQGLALIKYDAYESALASGILITADSAPLNLSVPEWALPKWELHRQGKVGL